MFREMRRIRQQISQAECVEYNELSRNSQENRLRGTKSIQSPDNGVNRPILSLTFFDL